MLIITTYVTYNCHHAYIEMLIYAATAGETFRFVNNSDGPISIVLVGLSGNIGTVSAFRIV